MEVILREDVQDLGTSGEVVIVRRGFARNYLIPQSLAVEATRRNLRQLEHEKGLIERHAAKRRAEAADIAGKIGGMSVTVAKPVGEDDRLYGSVTAKDIAEGLAEEGITGVGKKRIHLDEPIRKLGIYDVPLRLDGDNAVDIKLWVVAK